MSSPTTSRRRWPPRTRRQATRRRPGRILEKFERRASREYVSAFSIAVIHTALGERRQGIDWLLRGIRTRGFAPMLDPLRSDPCYPGVLAGMGLGK